MNKEKEIKKMANMPEKEIIISKIEDEQLEKRKIIFQKRYKNYRHALDKLIKDKKMLDNKFRMIQFESKWIEKEDKYLKEMKNVKSSNR